MTVAVDFVHDELSVVGQSFGIAKVAAVLWHQDLRSLVVLEPILELFLELLVGLFYLLRGKDYRLIVISQYLLYFDRVFEII